MRIVLDTSAVVSALRSDTGAAAEIVRLTISGELVLLMDLQLAYEYRDVAFRTHQLHRFGKSRTQVSDILDLIEAVAEAVVVYFSPRPLSPDPNDDMVLDVAINGRADAIVTFNAKHFTAAAAQYSIQVLTPAELLQTMRERR